MEIGFNGQAQTITFEFDLSQIWILTVVAESYSTAWLARDTLSVMIKDTASQGILHADMTLQAFTLCGDEGDGRQIIPPKRHRTVDSASDQEPPPQRPHISARSDSPKPQGPNSRTPVLPKDGSSSPPAQRQEEGLTTIEPQALISRRPSTRRMSRYTRTQGHRILVTGM